MANSFFFFICANNFFLCSLVRLCEYVLDNVFLQISHIALYNKKNIFFFQLNNNLFRKDNLSTLRANISSDEP